MMKKLVIFGLIAIFLLSGCEQLKELYGIQPSGEEEYVPLEEIKIEEETELPPLPPAGEEITEDNLEEIIETGEETEEELPEEIIEIIEGLEETEEIEIIEIIEEPEEVTEIIEEEPKGEAKVLIVKETDLVSLKPQASDPDKDALVFSYTTPIDDEGKWETTYGDAGEYTITLTASDGELSAAKDILIIVNKKEEVPVINEALPGEETLTSKENSELEFSVVASDLNKDALIYSWRLDGEEKSTEKSYTYNLGYDDAGQHTVRIIVSDGVADTSQEWSITVENVNRKPVLDKISDIKVKETEVIVLEPIAADLDKEDTLIFSIDNDNFRQIDGRFEWETNYDNSGEYTVTITASDGKDEVSQEVEITIGNVNRPPVIEDIILG
jgi:PKD repeat protein